MSKEKMKTIKNKESNPEALYYVKPKVNIPNSIGSLRGFFGDVFSPRGDHAKDAFDQLLSDELSDFDED